MMIGTLTLDGWSVTLGWSVHPPSRCSLYHPSSVSVPIVIVLAVPLQPLDCSLDYCHLLLLQLTV